MSTVTQVLLVAPVQLTAVDAAYYTAPALTVAKIGRAVLFNSDTIPHQVTVNVTQTTSSVPNEILVTVLAPKQTYVSPEMAGLVLPPGYEIRAVCDLAAQVNLMISGQITVG